MKDPEFLMRRGKPQRVFYRVTVMRYAPDKARQTSSRVFVPVDDSEAALTPREIIERIGGRL